MYLFSFFMSLFLLVSPISSQITAPLNYCSSGLINQRQINNNEVEITIFINCDSKFGYDLYLSSSFNSTPLKHLELSDFGPVHKLSRFIVTNSDFDRSTIHIEPLKGPTT